MEVDPVMVASKHDVQTDISIKVLSADTAVPAGMAVPVDGVVPTIPNQIPSISASPSLWMDMMDAQLRRLIGKA